MKKSIILILLFFIIKLAFPQESVVFHEGFEDGTKPSGWSEQKIIGQGGTPAGPIVSWQYRNGGYFDYPDHSYGHSDYNAMFQLESYNGETTILITPPIDLSDVTKPELRFAHVQQTWYFSGQEYNDILNVYYKRGIDSSWVLMQSYEDPVEDWVLRSILLPDSSLSSTYYIGFEGITGFGYGTCIDTVHVMETGIISKYLDSYSIKQASTDIVPTNTTNNPILNILFNVKGNDGEIYLDSLKVTSLNDDDNDISNSGVKLYFTEDSTFKDPVQIGSSVNFVDGVAHFTNLSYRLPRGVTSVWVTYDLAPATSHEVHDHVLDAKIEAEGIYISGSSYPFADKSPEGDRLLKESIFKDGFETDLGWIFNGSFERATPTGLGDTYPGNPDPENALNGNNVIGTDLTGDGVYHNNLAERQDSAVSPTIDCFYYKDVKLYFARWLNVEAFDVSWVDLSNDNGTSWNSLWYNAPSAVIDNSWEIEVFDLEDADFQEEVKVRFALGTSSPTNQYTGWNIDDFILIGDFISKDVGITGITLPVTSCGNTSNEDITVYIENYAGEITPNSVPLRYEIDNSGSYIVDAYPASIDIGDSTIFTFTVGADLTSAGFHNIKVETILTGDEISENNSMTKTIFSYPTYSLPYSENFESNNGYYLPGGLNSSWEYGEPSGIEIGAAASGTKAWVTNLDGLYNNNDSSFIESPCFNFGGTDSIIFEFKSNVITEDQTDGLTVLYSLNEGSSWDPVPNESNFYWNWYNETLISELELPGIDTTDGEWRTFRTILPPEVSNQSNVKFRLLFESNGTFRYEGAGIDDVKIYEAPHDVGVSSIIEPFTACEWSDATQVKVNVENFGITTLAAGSKIPVGLDFQGSYYTTDTLTLATTLAPGETAQFTFTETVDMSTTGDYDFSAYTLLESDPYFYNETVCNDTTNVTARVDGMPNYDIGWIIGSDDLDTLLDAGAGYDDYLWHDESGFLAATQTYQTAGVGGVYYVTVSRTNTLYCEADDSLKVVSSLIDVKLDSVLTELDDSCQRFELTELQVTISNQGSTLNVDDTIPFGYQINDLPVVYDTLTLDRTLTTNTDPATDTINFTFSEKLDLTVPDEYTIQVFTNFASDLNRSDDDTTVIINTWGLPDVELAYDTIYSSQADTLTLDAGSGFINYEWNSGSSVQTETPTNSSYYYKVTVTADHSCGTDTDSTYIETHDLSITDVTSPVDICEDDATGLLSLDVEITNFSDSVYSSTTETVYYEYDGGAPVMATPTITLAAGGTTVVNIGSIDASTVGEHTLKVYTSSDIDANHNNDTAYYSFNTWPEPAAKLAFDTIFTTKADTIQLIAEPGLASYNWSDGSSNDTLEVTKKYSQRYAVTVTDVNGCGTDEDSTQIITYNVGINELIYPLSACEHTSNEKVIVAVKNYSYDTLKTGTVIPISYKINSGTTVNENFVLSTNLDPQKTVNYTFTTRANLAGTDTYRFELITNFQLDVVESNDTYIDAIKTFGYPTINLGDDIYTTQPETVTLVAEPGFQGYFWDDGTKNDSLEVDYLATRSYSITVNDINGCEATDDITVYTYDLAPAALNTPVSQCELSSTETVSMDIINNSLDTLLNGDQVNVSYVLNSGAPVNESFNLSVDSLKPGETVSYTFSQTADLSANQTHQIDLSAEFNNNDAETNDGITRNIEYQKPIFDLGAAVNTADAEYTIDAGSGYTDYLWFDDSDQSTYTVSINNQNSNNYYAVTVTNSDGCEAADSLQVTFTTTADLELTQLVTPVSQCWNESETYPVEVVITNVGVKNIYPGSSFTVGYLLDGADAVTETFNVSTTINANDTRSYTFDDEISFNEARIYEFKPFVKISNDQDITNDTLTSDNRVEISAPDNILEDDSIFFTNETELRTNITYLEYTWSSSNFDQDITSSTVSVSETGWYYVSIVDEFGCQGEDSVYCKQETVGIDHIIYGNGYQISYYPNPVSSKLFIDFSNSKPLDVMVELVSLNGQVIYNGQLSKVEGQIEQIDVDSFAHGVYYLRLEVNDDYYIRKIIIQ